VLLAAFILSSFQKLLTFLHGRSQQYHRKVHANLNPEEFHVLACFEPLVKQATPVQLYSSAADYPEISGRPTDFYHDKPHFKPDN